MFSFLVTLIAKQESIVQQYDLTLKSSIEMCNELARSCSPAAVSLFNVLLSGS
jgi:hypothetical protein